MRQTHPFGLGHAILKAKPFIGNDPFIIALGDDIVYNDGKTATSQLIETYEKYGASVLGVQNVSREDVCKYGIVKSNVALDEKTVGVEDFIEKPSVEEAPSTLACLGRYLLS